MPLLPPPVEPHARALLLLLLLAREAELALEQVDSGSARTLVARGLTRARPAWRHRTGPQHDRPWMCRTRWTTDGD